VVIAWAGSVWTLDNLYWVDLTLAPAIGCLLAGLATGRPWSLLRLLDTRPLRSLGLASYSLYLTHGPIVVVVYELVVVRWFGHGAEAFLVALALTVPLAVLFARGFAAAFERRGGASKRGWRVPAASGGVDLGLAHAPGRQGV